MPSAYLRAGRPPGNAQLGADVPVTRSSADSSGWVITDGTLRRGAARRPAGRAQVVVLVPAHNEASAIDATIASLRRQTRPPDRIVVVADNCSDATEDVSLLHGAEVVTTAGNSARKAGALNQALRQILPGLGRGRRAAEGRQSAYRQDKK